MSFMRSITVAVPLLALTELASAGPGWTPYSNPETGLHVDVPQQVLSRDLGDPDGAGQKFVSADGRADLTVQTMRNDGGLSPAKYLAAKNPPAHIVYRRITDRFFVVSSYRGDQIFYTRCNFAGRVAHCVAIKYPAREKKQWDGIVTRVSLSLR